MFLINVLKSILSSENTTCTTQVQYQPVADCRKLEPAAMPGINLADSAVKTSRLQPELSDTAAAAAAARVQDQ